MHIDTEAKIAKARALFLGGNSCSQAVFAAFADEMSLDASQALRLASAMGGGLGGLRQTCGAFTGAVMALGALEGYESPEELEQKKRVYARVQTMHAALMDECGSSNCAELLKSADVAAKAEPSPCTPEYYRTRPCVRYVEACARILCEELADSSLL